jgi:V8-like Glu-specific endopeptidase
MSHSCFNKIAIAVTALPTLVFAQTAVTISTVPAAQAEYWTAERFKAAKPLDLPRVGPEALQHRFEATNSATPIGRAAAMPTVDTEGAARQLFLPTAPSSTITPQARGTSGANYTSTRVFPIFTGTAAPFSADRAFPYRAAGKLFFSINDSPFICSASVIAFRIVATAGHCVHSGTASGFYRNFVFVPAFRDGTAPFGSWTPRLVRVTSTWASGGGGFPNAADYAMMEMNDRTISGAVRRIANLTGWLGWQTLSLASNHTSKLGYPANLDGAQKMQNVMSNNFQALAPNTVVYGSDAAGGSSGGPWVQNLEVASVGQDGQNLGSNRVVGITSYGYIDPAVKVSGSSILDSRWSTMFSSMCAARVGNC